MTRVACSGTVFERWRTTGGAVRATQTLHDLGQSLWLDNISRGILDDRTLRRHVREWSVTGLTSNPTIFDRALGNGDSYDDAIRRRAAEGKSGDALFFELAIEDLARAADLLRPVHDGTGGVDRFRRLALRPPLGRGAARHGAGGTPESPPYRDRPAHLPRVPRPPDGGDAEAVLEKFTRAGADDTAPAARLQREGAASCTKSWKDLLDRIAAKRAMLAQPSPADGAKP